MENTKKSYFSLISGAILISFSPVLIKDTGAPGTVSVFYRLFFGTLVLIIPFAYSRIKNKEKLNLKGVLFASLAGLSLAIDMAMWATGIMSSNAAMPTLTANLTPLWVGIGGFLFFKERRTARFWIGLAIAMIGIAFLVIHDLYQPNGIFKGLMLGLFAGIFYGGFLMLVQMGRRYLDTLSFLFLSSLSTTIFLGIFMLFQNLEFTGYSTKAWTLFVIMGVMIQAGAWFLINFAQGHLPASLVAPTLLAQPVLTGVVAFLLLGEALTLWQIIGGIIVVIGIYTVHFAKQRKKTNR
ncbi:MAG TPA: DMT family transporter [Bacteroidales bacterium]|nr:DMT family transporter [Bacteroidales bacterium]